MRCRIIPFILPAFLFLWASCSDDDSFSTSPSHILSFSTDTVRLDTVFSNVPTATTVFRVYNRSGAGLRCTNVRLRQGNQTGFLVNVDGANLGKTEGYRTSDVEIRNKDSINVFVALTSPLSHQVNPKAVEDDLLFTLESGVEQKVCLQAWAWDATKLTHTTLTHDTTLSDPAPIIIYGGITVGEGATLTISPGTTLYFHDKAGIDVHGKLVCEGTPTANIVLRGDRLDKIFPYLPYDRISGQWKGLRFHKTSYENRISYTDIHGANDAIVCDSSDASQLKLTLLSTTVHNSKGTGVLSYNSRIEVKNCQITNALSACMAIYGGSALLLHNTIAQLYPFDSNRGSALFIGNRMGDKIFPLQDFRCINTLVTGYADDVINGDDRKEGTPFNYRFENCLLRTPEVKDDATHYSHIIWENVSDTVAAGWKNFKEVDTRLFRYDFRLSKKSLAIDKADATHSLPTDKDGQPRDGKPDIGCYEYKKD